MLLITDGRLEHSDLPIDDDDFVDAPPSWKVTSIHEDSPNGGAAKVEKSVDSKGKAKVDSACAVEFPCSIEPPSFDLGLGFTQPSQFVAKTSKKVEVQVESVISNVLKDTECIEQEAARSFGLPVKRAPKLAKALQSPYVVDEMKQMKSSENVVVFEHYNQNVQDADVADFQNWFQRRYKPHNKKKFNDKDDAIRPPFSIGQYLVRNTTWWYKLVSREVSLTSSVSYYKKVTVLKSMSQYRSLYNSHTEHGSQITRAVGHR
ncbi:Hypothetical predicted protein [Olea europaea subsp. europaea]|uniref:Uncharacterized protein n=1 Tax=Olea europaea subsp. europaea TaxID=158383 RepID=A0A8S0UT89_OLEEU|nr:Hypothetical predicted protein [Olea europaea subsp. europaea]